MKKNMNKYSSGNVILKQQEQEGAVVLGDCNSAVNLAIIKPNKIKTIISIGLQAQPDKDKISQDIQHRVYDIHDNKQQKLPVELLDQVVSIIDQGRMRGGVLIHCYAGVSRSSSFTIAYVMYKKKLSYDKAKQRVKKYRPCIHPGDGFVRQLQYYEKVLMKRQEQRLAKLKASQIKQIKQQTKKQQQEKLVEPVKIKRGVKGAVKSAQNQTCLSVRNSEKQECSSKVVEETQKQQTQKQFKLPPISRKDTKLSINPSKMEMMNGKGLNRSLLERPELEINKQISTISSIKNTFDSKVKFK